MAARSSCDWNVGVFFTTMLSCSLEVGKIFQFRRILKMTNFTIEIVQKPNLIEFHRKGKKALKICNYTRVKTQSFSNLNWSKVAYKLSAADAVFNRCWNSISAFESLKS